MELASQQQGRKRISSVVPNYATFLFLSKFRRHRPRTARCVPAVSHSCCIPTQPLYAPPAPRRRCAALPPIAHTLRLKIDIAYSTSNWFLHTHMDVEISTNTPWNYFHFPEFSTIFLVTQNWRNVLKYMCTYTYTHIHHTYLFIMWITQCMYRPCLFRELNLIFPTMTYLLSILSSLRL